MGELVDGIPIDRYKKYITENETYLAYSNEINNGFIENIVWVIKHSLKINFDGFLRELIIQNKKAELIKFGFFRKVYLEINQNLQ